MLSLLEGLRNAPNLGEPQRAELDQTIVRIERYYFGHPDGDAPNLEGIAEEWMRRA